MYALEFEENYAYIETIVDVFCFTAFQGIIQRGRNENPDNENKGNLLELLELMSKLNPTVKTKLESKTAKYNHRGIQNEILSIMSDKMLETISEEIQKAKCFAIMFD